MSSANLSKGITWCLPGSTQCLSSSICLMGWSVSIWAGSQLCLSANVLLWESCWCLPGLSSASACRCLSSELNRCLPRSVSQCLLPNLSKGITWCLSGSAQCLSSQRLSNGLDQRSIWAGSHLSFLPMSMMRILLMSVWTGFTCFLANVFEGEFNRCLPKVFLTSFAKSVCFSANVFSGGTCWCLLGLSSRVFLPVSF